MKKIIAIPILATLLILGDLRGYSQSVGISANGSIPNSSALLDVDAAGSTPKRGLLIPRVALSSTTDVATILTPAVSLLLYNTASTGDVTPGFYFWDGSKWQTFVSSKSPNAPCYTCDGY